MAAARISKIYSLLLERSHPIGERFQEAVMFHSIGFDPWKYTKNLNYCFLSFPKGCVTCDSREASCEAAVADDSVENKGEPPPALPR